MTKEWSLEEFSEALANGKHIGEDDQMAVVFADADFPLGIGFQKANKVVFVGEQMKSAPGFKSDKVELEVDKTFESNTLKIDRAYRITFDCADQAEVECAFAICAGLRKIVRESHEGLSLSAVESFIKGAFNKAPISVEVGLFGELLALYSAKSVSKALSTWHADNFDTYDFGNAAGYLEVKTTSTSVRSHWLSWGQLQKVPSERVTICSFVVNLIPDGVTVQELAEMVTQKLSTGELSLFADKISKYPVHAFARRFDLKSAIESRKLVALEALSLERVAGQGILNQKWLVDFDQFSEAPPKRSLPFSF
jgi:hypothetical protein